jgi:hypothetical protein
MPESLNVTGHWTGHYTQRDQRRAIAAELTQQGAELRGRMRDVETVFERSVFEVAAEGGLPPGADEQIVAHLRRQFPDDPRAPIRAASTVPPDSLLAGSVRGHTVAFLKTYQGEAFTGFQVGGQRVGITVTGHAVYYHGEVSADGETIEGTWWIDPDGHPAGRRTEGTFVLRRQDG